MDETFPIKLDRDGAWLLRAIVRPGPSLPPDVMPESAIKLQQWVFNLREKVNNTILRFEDEPETSEIEINIGRDEAWLLDHNLSFDGGGTATDLLIQVFRGLWRLDNTLLPAKLVAEPPTPPREAIKDILDTRLP